jgi:hypothetical protein
MSDNKGMTGTQDKIRVDANDKSEVEYVHQQFPHLQHAQVLDAIKSKGPMREDIVKYLKTLK